MIEIEVKNAQHALDLVHQIQTTGLIINKDFIWAYKQRTDDGFSYHDTSHKVQFTFRDNTQELFFKLKLS